MDAARRRSFHGFCRRDVGDRSGQIAARGDSLIWARTLCLLWRHRDHYRLYRCRNGRQLCSAVFLVWRVIPRRTCWSIG